MGEDTWATGIFPPLPSTVYGALRTAYLAEHPEEQEAIDEKTSKLSLAGIYLLQEEHGFLFPAPADCYVNRERPGNAFLQYNIDEPGSAILSAAHQRTHNLLAFGFRPAEGLFLPKESLSRYLEDISTDDEEVKLRQVIPKDDLVQYEDKIGLGRDNATRSAQESMLYRVQMQRWRDLILVVDSNLEELGIGKPALMKLGAEGKAVYLSPTEHLPEFPEQEKLGPCFKLYLATPALFSNGWLPKSLQAGPDGHVKGEWQGLDVELLAAFTGKPQRLGGFDIKQKCPKPMRLAVPAGSVYYLHAPGASAKQINSAFHDQMISEYLPKQGYGHALVGALNHSHFKTYEYKKDV